MQREASETYRPESLLRGVGRRDSDARLPGPDDPYKAAGSAESQELSRLVLVMGKDGYQPGATAYTFLQYVHLGMGEFTVTPEGQVFRVVFSDIQPKLVTIHGRNLLAICDAIAQRRMPWLRVADRDFRAGDGVAGSEPVITKIEIRDWKPAEGDPALAEGGGPENQDGREAA